MENSWKMIDLHPCKELWDQSSSIFAEEVQELDFLIYRENPYGEENYAIFLVESLNKGSLRAATLRRLATSSPEFKPLDETFLLFLEQNSTLFRWRRIGVL